MDPVPFDPHQGQQEWSAADGDVGDDRSRALTAGRAPDDQHSGQEAKSLLSQLEDGMFGAVTSFVEGTVGGAVNMLKAPVDGLTSAGHSLRDYADALGWTGTDGFEQEAARAQISYDRKLYSPDEFKQRYGHLDPQGDKFPFPPQGTGGSLGERLRTQAKQGAHSAAAVVVGEPAIEAAQKGHWLEAGLDAVGGAASLLLGAKATGRATGQATSEPIVRPNHRVTDIEVNSRAPRQQASPIRAGQFDALVRNLQLTLKAGDGPAITTAQQALVDVYRGVKGQLTPEQINAFKAAGTAADAWSARSADVAAGSDMAWLQQARDAIVKGDTAGLARVIGALQQQVVQLQSSGQQDRAAAHVVVAEGLREDLRRLQSNHSMAREDAGVNSRVDLQSHRNTPDIQYSLDKTFLDPKKTAVFQKRMQTVLEDNFGRGGASVSLRVVDQPKKTELSVDKTLQELIPKAQGNVGQLSLRHFLDLAPNGATVDLSVTRDGKSVQVEIKHPAFDALHFWLGNTQRGTASAVEDLVVISNRGRLRAPPGLASVFTLRLVEKLTQLGVESLSSSAAGRGRQNYDGNHVWPLLGFDGPISGSMRRQMLEPDNAARLSDAGIDAHNITRLSELVFNADGSYNAEGVRFLKRNRKSLDIDVDLTDPAQLGRLRATLERFGLSSLIHGQ
jgi:hypothetical protein